MTLVPADRPLIGDLIRRARQRRNWTQRELAARAGVDRKTVDNWENDRSYPRNTVVLEDVLGLSLNGDDEGHPVATPDELWAAIRQLEEAARRAVGDANGRAS